MKLLVYLSLGLILTACSDDARRTKDTLQNIVRDKQALATAYTNCVQGMSRSLLEEAPNIQDKATLQALISGVKQSCQSAVYKTCDLDMNNEACKLILEQYR